MCVDVRDCTVYAYKLSSFYPNNRFLREKWGVLGVQRG